MSERLYNHYTVQKPNVKPPFDRLLMVNIRIQLAVHLNVHISSQIDYHLGLACLRDPFLSLK